MYTYIYLQDKHDSQPPYLPTFPSLTSSSPPIFLLHLSHKFIPITYAHREPVPPCPTFPNYNPTPSPTPTTPTSSPAPSTTESPSSALPTFSPPPTPLPQHIQLMCKATRRSQVVLGRGSIAIECTVTSKAVNGNRRDKRDIFFGFALAIPNPDIVKLKRYGVDPRLPGERSVPKMNGTSSIYWPLFPMSRNRDYERKFKLSFTVIDPQATGGVLTFRGSVWQNILNGGGLDKINYQYSDPVEVRLI
jgi:hypothetical protein